MRPTLVLRESCSSQTQANVSVNKVRRGTGNNLRVTAWHWRSKVGKMDDDSWFCSLQPLLTFWPTSYSGGLLWLDRTYARHDGSVSRPGLANNAGGLVQRGQGVSFIWWEM